MRDLKIVEGIAKGGEYREVAMRALLRKSRKVPKSVESRTQIQKELVEECFHDAVMELQKKVEANEYEVRKEGKLKGFLYKVTHRKAVKAVKKEKEIELRSFEEEGHEALMNEAVKMETRIQGFLDEVLKEELILICRKVLDEVGPRCKKILEEVYLHDVPMKEVAEEMGLSPENIRQCKFRCLRAIRKILIEKGVWYNG